MTFLELQQTVISDIDEDISDTALLQKIKNYINRGYKEVAKRELTEKTVNATVSTGKVRKPTDFFGLVDVKQDDESIGHSVEGSFIIVEVDSGQVKLTYNYIPVIMENDDDETETNESNVEFIINYAKWLYYLSEGMMDEATLFKREADSINIVKNDNKVYRINTVFGVI